MILSGAQSHFRLDTVVASVLGGIAGGLLVWALAPQPTPKPAPASPDPASAAVNDPSAESEPAMAGEATPDKAVPDDAQAARIEALEAAVRALQKSAMRQAKVDAYEEPDDAGHAKRVLVSADDPKFQNAVRAVVDAARLEAEQAEQDRRDERQDKRIARQLETLTKKLNLSEAQASQMEAVLESRADTFRELRESPDRPVTRGEWRQKRQEINADMKQKLSAFLDEDQLAAYDEYRKEERGFRGRR